MEQLPRPKTPQIDSTLHFHLIAQSLVDEDNNCVCPITPKMEKKKKGKSRRQAIYLGGNFFFFLVLLPTTLSIYALGLFGETEHKFRFYFFDTEVVVLAHII